jgi:hypothetical protein
VRKRRRDWPQRHRETEIGGSNEPERKDNAEAQRTPRFAEKKEISAREEKKEGLATEAQRRRDRSKERTCKRR